jgi:choline dehydrogenase-like flavoprotein
MRAAALRAGVPVPAGDAPARAGAALGSADARRIVAFAEAATPAGRFHRAPDAELVAAVAAGIEEMGPPIRDHYRAMLLALDLAALPVAGRRLSELPLPARTRALARLNDGILTGVLARGALAPIKLAQVVRGPLPDHLGGNVGVGPPVRAERQRWEQQIVDGRTISGDETFEVDCVIVGSGAGGAPVAHALASRGHAVLVLEAGARYGRESFHGRSWERAMRMMRQHVAIGPAPILVPVGETVGGTTTVNSGTCLPPPLEVLRRWRFEDELVELDPASLEPYLRRVEAQLGVASAEELALGNVGRIVARGAEKLGWSHGPLSRNAPGCDGQGTCCFGCPTDAKRSVNVSYLPAALRAGAMLIHHARVEEILVAGGKAIGVAARVPGGSGARLRVHARAVVLSCGAIGTPALLLAQGLANRSGQVGKNLTVHPASNAWALFDERVDGWRGIPQGYGIDSFVNEGIRFEGASVPLDIAAPTSPLVGEAWTRFVERFDHLLSYGYMIADTSRGRVILGPGRKPRLLYRLNETDRRRLLRGQVLLARLLLAAGAREVQPSIRGLSPIRDERDLERFEREASGRVAGHRLELSAYHPLGTCRMGRDPRRSVVGPSHETHDVPNLFVVDGSCVNGPLGVNPQVTIMTLAERSSELIAERIEAGEGRPVAVAAPSRAPRVRLEFEETMQGQYRRLADGAPALARFSVRAFTAERGFARGLASGEGAALALEGTIHLGGLATDVPCRGTLRMRPLRRRGTLVYDLDFTGDDAVAYHLHGEKNVSLRSLVRTMATLHIEVARSADGVPIARGVLTFALSDLSSFLSTWRLRARGHAALPAPRPG